MSSDDCYTEINLENQQSFQYDDINVFKSGMYVACIYDDKWYIGNTLEVSKGFADVFVDFTKAEEKSFTWPSKNRPILEANYQRKSKNVWNVRIFSKRACHCVKYCTQLTAVLGPDWGTKYFWNI